MKKLLCLILCLLFVFSIASCNEVKDEKKQDIVFVLPSEASSYDNNLGTETYGLAIMGHIAETLVRLDSDGNLTPAAAKSWDIEEDNTKFIFHLRDNLKWSDGEDITAQHFKDGFLRIIDPEAQAINAGTITPYLINAKKYYDGEVSKDEVAIKVIDDKTIEFKFNTPIPFMLDILTHKIFTPTRTDIIETAGEGWDKNVEYAFSSGPFVLSEYVENEYTTVIKNNNYWNAENVKIDKIVFKMRGEDTDIISQYNNGEIDGVYEIRSSDLRVIIDSDLESHKNLMPSTAFLIVNHDSKILANKDFRKALSISIDREYLIKDVLQGAGVPSDYLVPYNYKIGGESFRDYTELVKEVNVTEARKIIEKLKEDKIYDGKPLKFFFSPSANDSVAAKEIVRQYKELGLDIDERSLPWADIFDAAYAGEYDIIMMGWGADYPHPMTFLSLFLENSFYGPLIRWQDENYERALNDSQLITDEKEYLDALRDIEGMILDEHHIIPLYFRKNLVLMNKDLKGWYQHGSNYIFDEAYFE